MPSRALTDLGLTVLGLQTPRNGFESIRGDPIPDSLSEAHACYGDKHALMAAYTYRNPYDQALTNLIGELSTRSVEFRTRWAAHDVRQHRTGTKRLHHPVVGDLELAFERLDVTADPGLVLQAYSADPGSPSHDALSLLASWAATLDQEQALPTAAETTITLPDRPEA